MTPTDTKSETPRCDAEEYETDAHARYHLTCPESVRSVVDAEFARQLERELNSANEREARYVEGINLNNEEITQTKALLERLANALINAKGYILANARESVHGQMEAYNVVLSDYAALTGGKEGK